MRIGYFADGPWSHRALELLLEDESIEVAFIVPRIVTTDKVLADMADIANIDFLRNSKINTEEFRDRVRLYDCDLFVSMSFNQIFRAPVINLPPLKTINCHAGKLPYYRGRNILNWALINDEKEFGITVHYIDEGIDTGDIILQRTYPISDKDTYRTLLELAHYECAAVLYDAIKQIQVGTAKRIVQSSIDSVGMYCGPRGEGDEIIDWKQSSRDLFNFIRAICPPGPGARTRCQGEEVTIHSAEMIVGAPIYKGIPGQVVGREDNTFIVKTMDSLIRLVDIEFSRRLKVGDRLG